MSSLNATAPVEFSVYLLPISFAVLNFVACLSALLATYFDKSLFHNSWNILYQLKTDSVQHTYIIRLVYYYRKSTIDFTKTSVVVQLTEVSGLCTTIRIPSKFFNPNKHNVFTRERGTIKFLLIRDTELKVIEKIGLSHDYQGGELNVSLMDIHSCNTNSGYVGLVERTIAAVSVHAMHNQQTFMATSQNHMDLEGDFAISQGISPLEVITTLYLFFSVVCYLSAQNLINYYQNFTIKQNYTLFNSIQQATIFGLSYFFFLFGCTSIIYDVTKYFLNGKPRSRCMKILYLYVVLCIVVGIALSMNTVFLLDPDKLQYSLKDANLVPHFLRFWVKMAMFAMGIAIFYGIPYYVIYFVFTSLVFKGYSDKN